MDWKKLINKAEKALKLPGFKTQSGKAKQFDNKNIIEAAQEILTKTINKMKTEKNKDANFTKIPAFPIYGVNTKTKEVKNFKSGNIVVPKKANGKYQLTSPSGVRKEKSYAEIIALLPAGKKEKAPKENKKVSAEPKKTVTSKSTKTEVELDKDKLMKDPKVKEIMELTGPKHRKIYELNKAGYTNKQMQIITGSTCQVVSRDLWMYKVGKLTA